MAIPPKSDPSRPVFLAARSMMWLGFIFMVGVSSAFPALLSLLGDSAPTPATFVIAGMGLALLAQAALYIICSIRICAMRRWAVNCGLTLALLHLCGATLLLASFFLGGGSTKIDIVLVLLCAAGLIQLVIHLRKAGDYIETQNQRGFEPLIPSKPNADRPMASLANPPSQSDQSRAV